jgi:Xaa-Pro aminopeptidase
MVHRVESHHLDALPGSKSSYSRWTEQASGLRELLRGARTVAMQYSPDCAVPYVSMVDGGTVELVRAAGVEIRTSADLVQLFEARWTDAQFESHIEAARRMDRIRGQAFGMIRDRLPSGLTEWDVWLFMRRRFEEDGLITDHGPIVAVNANASDPHYEPAAERHSPIKAGDLVLIDMWAKLQNPSNSVYYDITWTGYCGESPPERMQEVFRAVAGARDRGVDAVVSGAAKQGYQVDDAARSYIESHGFGEYFIHRTGHSIGTDVHGAGANMDNFETHDVRRILPRTCFSVEPGIYLPDFGIRSEVNVYVGADGARVTGEIQRELLRLA